MRRLLGLLFSGALIAGLAVPPVMAQDSVTGAVKGVGKSTKKAAETTGKAVGDTSKKAAKETKKGAKKAAKKTQKGAEKVGDTVNPKNW